MALDLRLTENAISLILNEKRQPRFDTLLSIANYLEVDIRDCFNKTIENDQAQLVNEIIESFEIAREKLHKLKR